MMILMMILTAEIGGENNKFSFVGYVGRLIGIRIHIICSTALIQSIP